MLTVRVLNMRRLAAWLLIVEQVLVSAGAPLPCSAAAVRSNERFPCEHCACGCRTAEQCWRQCCCHTNEQKIVWARANGVAVPEYVMAAAERERAAADKPKCAHCAAPGASKTETSAAPSTRDRQEKAGHRTRPPRGITWLDVAKCHGVTSYFEVAGPGWPAEPPVELHLALPPVGRVVRQLSLGNPTLPPAPPTPPPKSA
jgi:hypothetical protein